VIIDYCDLSGDWARQISALLAGCPSVSLVSLGLESILWFPAGGQVVPVIKVRMDIAEQADADAMAEALRLPKVDVCEQADDFGLLCRVHVWRGWADACHDVLVSVDLFFAEDEPNGGFETPVEAEWLRLDGSAV